MKWSGFSNVWKKGFIAGLMIVGFSFARADENDQSWLMGTVRWKATNQTAFQFGQQMRVRDDAHYYHHTRAGVVRKLGRGWTVGAEYWYVQKRNARGEWNTSDGLVVDPGYKLSTHGVDLTSRFRLTHFEQRCDGDCSSDIRPRFDLAPSRGFTDWGLVPYVADEIMYSFENGCLYRNRLFFGLRLKPQDRLSLNFFVMQELTERNGDWSENWNSGLFVVLDI